jgi:MOSC domain-containing protein YiiM
MPRPTLLSVNVGRPAPLATGSRVVLSSIVKAPVEGSVAVRAAGLEGDEQADRVHHGGVSKAVYAYASEDAAWWEDVLGQELGAAAFGENLTLAGVDCSGARIGERWRVGGAELRVTGPRVPCFKLAALMGDPRFVRRFARANRPGAYLGVTREGDVAAGDAVDVVHRPGHDVTVALVAAATLLDASLLPALEPARGDFTPELAAFVAARSGA